MRMHTHGDQSCSIFCTSVCKSLRLSLAAYQTQESVEGLPTKSNRRMFLRRGKPASDGLARMHATMERIIGQKFGTKRFLLDASMKVAKEDQKFFARNVKCRFA